MKILKICLLTLLLGMLLVIPVKSVFAQSTEPPIPPVLVNGNFVLDQLDWLSPSQEQEINAIVSKLDTDNLAQIAVVTQNDCGEDSQAYRNTFFRTWGIGHKDRNDGLLILVCWYDGNKDLRKVEQETGNGMEGTIPDLLTAKVFQEYFVPVFSSGKDAAQVISDGDAGKALVEMVKAYDGIIRGDTPEALTQTEQQDSLVAILSTTFLGLKCIWWLLILIIILIIILSKTGITGGGGGYYYGGSSSSSSSSDDSSSFGGGSSSGGGSSGSF